MTDTSAGTNQTFVIREKLAGLEQALLERDPAMPTLLRDIHTQLKRDPDVVTLLSEEECSILVRGLKQQTKTEIATTAKKKSPTKAMSRMTVDDL